MSVTLLLGVLLVSATLPACVRLFYPPLPAGAPDEAVGAVVVLGGGIGRRDGQWVPSDASLRRLLQGLEQARQTGLPMLLSGGVRGKDAGSPPEAELMAAAAGPSGDATLWLETTSHNTWTNAQHSAALLQRKGISRIYLVTDREHMTRSMLCFQAQGVEVVPVAVDRMPQPEWVPSSAALSIVPFIWYEWLALVWYELRY